MTDIAQVLLSDRIGGAETLAATLASQWSAAGVSSQTVYLDLSHERQSRSRRVWSLQARLHALSPRYIVAHSLLPARYVRMIPRIPAPVIYVLHSASDDYTAKWSQLLERAQQRRTFATVSVSKQQAEVFHSHFPRVECTVIPNPVGEGFRVDPMKGASKPLRAVSLARVTTQKRPDTWIEIVQQGSLLGMEFDWVGPFGDPADEVYLRGSISRLSCARFQGESHDVRAVLERADLLLHTSDREAALPIAILEAAAMGIPIVCSEMVAKLTDLPIPLLTFRAGRATEAVEVLRELSEDWSHYKELAVRAAPLVQEVRHPRVAAQSYLQLMKMSE